MVNCDTFCIIKSNLFPSFLCLFRGRSDEKFGWWKIKEANKNVTNIQWDFRGKILGTQVKFIIIIMLSRIVSLHEPPKACVTVRPELVKWFSRHLNSMLSRFMKHVLMTTSLLLLHSRFRHSWCRIDSSRHPYLRHMPKDFRPRWNCQVHSTQSVTMQ